MRNHHNSRQHLYSFAKAPLTNLISEAYFGKLCKAERLYQSPMVHGRWVLRCELPKTRFSSHACGYWSRESRNGHCQGYVEIRAKLSPSGNVYGNIMDKDTKGRPRNGGCWQQVKAEYQAPGKCGIFSLFCCLGFPKGLAPWHTTLLAKCSVLSLIHISEPTRP